MFSPVSEQCGLTSPHGWHFWRKQWHIRERDCDGIRFHPEPEPHKHRLRLTSWQWNSLNQYGATSPEATLSFTCKDLCRTPDGDFYRVKLKRWQYNNLVLANREVHQTWPQ
jgi:hypothetical protein